MLYYNKMLYRLFFIIAFCIHANNASMFRRIASRIINNGNPSSNYLHDGDDQSAGSSTSPTSTMSLYENTESINMKAGRTFSFQKNKFESHVYIIFNMVLYFCMNFMLGRRRMHEITKRMVTNRVVMDIAYKCGLEDVKRNIENCFFDINN